MEVEPSSHSSSPISTRSLSCTLKRGMRGTSHHPTGISPFPPCHPRAGSPGPAPPPPPGATQPRRLAPGKSPEANRGGEEGCKPRPTDTPVLSATPAAEGGCPATRAPHTHPCCRVPLPCVPSGARAAGRCAAPSSPDASPASRASASDSLAPPSGARSPGSRNLADPSLFHLSPGRLATASRFTPPASPGPPPRPLTSRRATCKRFCLEYVQDTLHTHGLCAPRMTREAGSSSLTRRLGKILSEEFDPMIFTSS